MFLGNGTLKQKIQFRFNLNEIRINLEKDVRMIAI
jgi:hypothetical protein